jgi:hypothetical protein
MVTSGMEEMAGRAIYWLAQRFVLFTAENSATGRSFGSAALSGSFEFGEIPVADDLRTSYWELTVMRIKKSSCDITGACGLM